jgi:hypothetical protein
MIEPNFDLMLWIIFAGWIVKAICRIGLGAAGKKKETKYDGGDVIAGVVTLVIALIVAFA